RASPHSREQGCHAEIPSWGDISTGRTHPTHTIDLGDWVDVKNFSGDPLQEKEDGPLQVLLTTFNAICMGENPTWIHYTQEKKSPLLYTLTSPGPHILIDYRCGLLRSGPSPIFSN
uniref:Uncharacterized protein n=1 Tax=Serinus canaria TaxID=9135 RepID=A0A8C9MDR8_SERCA